MTDNESSVWSLDGDTGKIPEEEEESKTDKEQFNFTLLCYSAP